jgi:hypothetical protein
MKAKFYFFFALCFLLLQSNLFAQVPGYILYVSDNEVDSGFVQLLQTEGYDLQLKGSAYSGLLTEQDHIDSCENAALIILSRNLATADFSSESTTDAADQWNGFDVPLISLSAWLMRSTRLQWFNSTQVNCNMDTISVTASGASHPIFEGITTTGLITFYDNDDGTKGSDWVGVVDNGPGNAIVLATDAAEENVAIALFESGLTFYDGTTQSPANDRIFFSAGKSDCGGASEPDALYNLNETGTTMFLNLVAEYVLKIGASVEESMATRVSVYPNPATDKVSIENMVNIEKIEIYSLSGNLIKTVEGKSTFDVSDFTQGMYMLKVYSGDEIRSSSFIKK